jgi:tRNA threonylcarbamoyladenosine biosynthesis protein TsaE
MTVITNSAAETEALGSALAARLRRGCVVALTGELGTGKTAFVRGIASGLNIAARVTSPTFTIVNEYPGDVPLFHFDFYRLSGARELADIGWDDYLERGGIVAAEWSDIAPELIPADAVRVDFEYLGDGARRVTLEAGGGTEVLF